MEKSILFFSRFYATFCLLPFLPETVSTSILNRRDRIIREAFTYVSTVGSGCILSSSLLRLFVRFALFFEPISPRLISFWLRRRLNNWRSRGLIDGYKLNTKRTSKFHYKIEVDLELNPQQTKRVLGNILVRILRFRR